jgi:hypothetical protein
VSEQDTVDFWDLFLAANQSNRVSANGLVSGDRMFLFAQFERDPRAPAIVRGTADLTNQTISEIKIPIIISSATNRDFADAENLFTSSAYCNVRRSESQILEPVPFRRIRGHATSNTLNEPFYDGLWTCINRDDLYDGDTIEFGAKGVREYVANAIWRIIK